MDEVMKPDIRARLGLRPVINVSGTMTALGASIATPEAIRAASEILPEWVEIDDLHRKASAVIAKETGAEAGFVTACAAAGVTLGVAAAMTGADLAKIEQLPGTAGMKNEVVIMMGHMTGYGAPVEQAVRLAGATVVPVGNVTDARAYQLTHAISERTAAALYVVSHHTVEYGQLPLDVFARICREKSVPVVADVASECDLKGFIAAGADIAVYSAQKFLGGLTAGIMAGRKDLIRACFLQNGGIGRGMKVGKESIVATMAALQTWAARDHAGIRSKERGYLNLWSARLGQLPGVRSEIIPDPTGNPIDRLKISVDPHGAGVTAWDLADALAAGDPPVIVRDHHLELGFFEMDPCNLHPGEELIVAERIVAELENAKGRNDWPRRTPTERKAAQFEKLLRWPD